MEASPFQLTANVYDLLHRSAGKDYEAEAIELHTQIQDRLPGAGRLLDVACGTGRHLAFLQRWYEIAGTDIEPAMLARARQRLPGVSLTCADMRTFDLQSRFDAIVCLFSAVGYLPTTADLDTAVGTMARHLRPGGVVIIDGWVRPDRWREPGAIHVLHGHDEEAGLTVVRMVRPRRDGSLTDLEMHYLIGTPDGIDHVVAPHQLTLFTDSDYRHAFEQAGLQVEVVASPMPDRDRYIGTRPTGNESETGEVHRHVSG